MSMKRNNGFTLIEVIVSIMLLPILWLAIDITLSLNKMLFYQAKHRAQAVFLANGFMDILRTYDYEALAFVAKGVPLGTALAFLLSAVGVSLPELMMLRSVMSVRLLAVFSGVVLVGTTLIGWLLNALY